MKYALNGLLALVLWLSAGYAQALDQYPPPAGSICDTAIAAYLSQKGNPQHGTVRIGANLERDGMLYFNLYDGWEDKIHGLHAADLPPLKGPAKTVGNIFDWSKTNGMWLLIMPGRNGRDMAQVFVAGKDPHGRAICPLLYKQPVDFDPASAPEDIFE